MDTVIPLASADIDRLNLYKLTVFRFPFTKSLVRTIPRVIAKSFMDLHDKRYQSHPFLLKKDMILKYDEFFFLRLFT